MGLYDDYDRDFLQKMGLISGLILFVFMLILTTVFIIFKVTAVVSWGWPWVFAPIWIPLLIGFIMAALGIKPPGQ